MKVEINFRLLRPFLYIRVFVLKCFGVLRTGETGFYEVWSGDLSRESDLGNLPVVGNPRSRKPSDPRLFSDPTPHLWTETGVPQFWIDLPFSEDPFYTVNKRSFVFVIVYFCHCTPSLTRTSFGRPVRSRSGPTSFSMGSPSEPTSPRHPLRSRRRGRHP